MLVKVCDEFGGGIYIDADRVVALRPYLRIGHVNTPDDRTEGTEINLVDGTTIFLPNRKSDEIAYRLIEFRVDETAPQS